MLPTLKGRIQTRLILFLFVGLPVTYLLATWWDLADTGQFADPFVFLIAFTIVGLLLDPVYIYIQRFRWDGDWPFAFQFFFTVVEFLIAFGLMTAGVLDAFLAFRIPFSAALTHFLCVFIPSFIALLGGLQVFLIRWRFKGGEIGRL